MTLTYDEYTTYVFQLSDELRTRVGTLDAKAFREFLGEIARSYDSGVSANQAFDLHARKLVVASGVDGSFSKDDSDRLAAQEVAELKKIGNVQSILDEMDSVRPQGKFSAGVANEERTGRALA